MFLISTPNNLKLLLQIILTERALTVKKMMAALSAASPPFSSSRLFSAPTLTVSVNPPPHWQGNSPDSLHGPSYTSRLVRPWDTNDWLKFLNRDTETWRRLNALTKVPTFLSFPARHQSSFGTAVPHIHLADSLIQALLLLVTGPRLGWNNSEGLWGSISRSCPSALQRPPPSAPLVTECLLLCPVIQIGFKPPASALHCNAIFLFSTRSELC